MKPKLLCIIEDRLNDLSKFDSDVRTGRIDLATGEIIFDDGTRDQMTLKKHNEIWHPFKGCTYEPTI